MDKRGTTSEPRPPLLERVKDSLYFAGALFVLWMLVAGIVIDLLGLEPTSKGALIFGAGFTVSYALSLYRD